MPEYAAAHRDKNTGCAWIGAQPAYKASRLFLVGADFCERVKRAETDQTGEQRHKAQIAKHELVVFVDSDSFVDPFAIYDIVQPFRDERMGGVSGRTDHRIGQTEKLAPATK